MTTPSTPTPQDSTPTIESVLNSGMAIPPQPAILLEIDALLARPGNSMTALGDLIAKDAGLCAGIFKLANSSFYRRKAPVDSVNKALTVLGMTQVINSVKCLALQKTVTGQELAYARFWERSNEVAGLSAVIASKVISACNIAPEQAYMAGLFHECGVPILMQRFPDYCGTFRLAQSDIWPDFKEEDQRLSTSYPVVGYLIAKHWGLPDFICQAIRFQHDRLHVEHAARTLVSILQMARHCYRVIHRHPFEDSALLAQAMEELCISKDEVKEFVEDVTETYLDKA